MTHRLLTLSVCVLVACTWGAVLAHAETAPAAPRDRAIKIVLDAGHTVSEASKSGVNSNDAAGNVVREADFNDEVVKLIEAEIKARLPRATVILTRPYGKDGIPGTKERSLLVDKENADLFLAIHHDAAQEVFVDHAANALAGQDAWTLKSGFDKVDMAAYDKIRAKGYTEAPPWAKGDVKLGDYLSGYSLYVTNKVANKAEPESKKFKESKRLAELMAKEIQTLGRKPALYHVEKITGEGRQLIDAARGIYAFDDLAVLRYMKAQIPAVLLEVGVIPNAVDQATVSDPQFRKKLATGIVNAIESYLADLR